MRAFLPDIHRDPIGRVLISTAQGHDADLVTSDGIIFRYLDVRTRWKA
jgi:PIN domain nuclease of toxin-antitoxin system